MSDSGWAHFNTGIAVGNLSATSTFSGALQWGNGKGLLTYGSDRGIIRADQVLEIQTNATSSPTAALTLDTSQNATFAGRILSSYSGTSAHTLQNATSNGTILTLTSTADSRTLTLQSDHRTLTLQSDHIFSNGNLYIGNNSYDTYFRGASYTFFNGNITISNAAPALNLTDTDNSSNIALSSVGGALVVNSPSDQVYQYGGTEKFRVSTSSSTFATHVVPGADSTYDIGATGNRWANIWVDNINGGTPTTGGPYLPLSGGTMTGNLRINDSVNLYIGSGTDLILAHNGTNSYVSNYTGDLYIENVHNTGDITFKANNGSSGVEDYLKLDGSARSIVVSASLGMYFNDGVAARWGNSGDCIIFHDATNTEIANATGNLNIKSTASTGDISFYADNKAGGTMEYFRVDGGATKVIASVNFDFLDNTKAEFGDSQELQIYHDGSNSKIQNNSGHLKIGVSSRIAIQNDAYDENIAEFIKDGAVNLYYDNSSRLSTAADGIIVGGVSIMILLLLMILQLIIII